MVEFLGKEFTGLVDLLTDRLQDLRQGQQVPRVVVLEAASGSGKSRVVREMYRRLCVGQQVKDNSGRGYWPFLDESDERARRGAEPLPFRKVIGPSPDGFQRGAGTLPEFFWLPVQCDQAPDGSMTPALELMWPSLRAHTRFLAEAWKKKATAGQQVRRTMHENLGAHVEDLTVEASLEVLTRFLDTLGVALPGAGVIPKATVGAITTVRAHRRLRRDVAKGGTLDPGLTAADKIAEALLRLVHRDLPLIVVVEDAHLMDQGLADLLFLLARPATDQPVLIVCTAWPEGADRDVYQEWLDSLVSDDDVDPWVDIVGRTTSRPFPSLALHDRVQIVRSFAPNTATGTADMIAAHWENPYALLLALTGPAIQNRLHHGAIDISQEDLARLPRDIEKVYQARWDELDPPVRTALMLAAGALPPGDAPVTWTFAIDVVAQAADAAGLANADAVRAGLNEAIAPLAWAVRIDPGFDLAAFREWLLARIARHGYYDAIPHSQAFTDAVRAEIVTRLSACRAPDGTLTSDDGSHLALARWLYTLDPASASASTALAALTLAENSTRSLRLDAASDLRQGTLTSRSPEFEQVVELLDNPARISVLPQPDALRAREPLAYALLQTGRPQEAIDAFSSLLDDMEAQGTSLRDLAKVRAGLTAALTQVGRMDEALANQRRLVSDLEKAGDQREELLTARVNLAALVGSVQGRAASIPALKALLAEQEAQLGKMSPQAFYTRMNIAVARVDAGRPQEAHKELRQVLTEQQEVLGDGHPDLLLTRERIAAALSAMGRDAEAAAELERLLPEQTRVFGAEHRRTLVTRANHATVVANNPGRQTEALRLQAAAIADLTRVLGRIDPETWGPRSGLAVTLIQVGRPEEAVVVLRSLLSDMEPVLGASHGAVVYNQTLLAWALSKSEQPASPVDGRVAPGAEVHPHAPNRRSVGGTTPRKRKQRKPKRHR